MDKPEQTKPTRRVMQVVEVAEDGASTPVTEERVFSQTEPPTSIEDRFGNPVEPTPQASEEKQKSVVSELFHKEEHAVGYPDISVKKKTSPFVLIVWIVIMFAAILLIGGILYLLKNSSTLPNKLIITPIPTIQAIPTGEVTPTLAIEKTDKTIQVLNGSGKSGVAATAKKLLEEKGYTVSETGNAKRFDYGKTEIYVKAGNEALLLLLSGDLSDSYPIGTTAATLDETASYSARIIIGKDTQ